MNKHRVLDLCSGIGGMHLGFERAGYEVVAWCEINEQARSVYERHFPGLQNWKDITLINPNDVPDIDLIAAGIPCQAFSNAGHRRGFEDARGTIVYDVLRIAMAKKPRYVVIENVPGLLTHDNGRTLSTMKRLFERIGYQVMVRKMHSEDFVPQHRERIFIVCEHNGQGLQAEWTRPKSDTRLLRDVLESEDVIPPKYYLKFDQVRKLFLGENNRKGAKVKPDNVNIVGEGYFSYLPVHENGNSGTLNALHDSKKVVTERKMTQINDKDTPMAERIYTSDGIGKSQMALGGGGGAKTGLYTVDRKIKLINDNEKGQGNRIYDTNGIATSQTAEGGSSGRGRTGVYTTERKIKMPNGNKYDSDKTCDSDGISPSLRVGGGPGKVIIPVLNPGRPNKRQDGRRYKTDGEPTFTLLAAEQHGILVSFDPKELPKLQPNGKPDTYIAVFADGERGVIVGYNSEGLITTYWVRRLTPVEGCRLQGFPDKWTALGADDKPISDSAQHRMIGNAVTVNVVEYIGRHLIWN